jgi:hypothetical protein
VIAIVTTVVSAIMNLSDKEPDHYIPVAFKDENELKEILKYSDNTVPSIVDEYKNTTDINLYMLYSENCLTFVELQELLQNNNIHELLNKINKELAYNFVQVDNVYRHQKARIDNQTFKRLTKLRQAIFQFLKKQKSVDIKNMNLVTVIDDNEKLLLQLLKNKLASINVFVRDGILSFQEIRHFYRLYTILQDTRDEQLINTIKDAYELAKKQLKTQDEEFVKTIEEEDQKFEDEQKTLENVLNTILGNLNKNVDYKQKKKC